MQKQINRWKLAGIALTLALLLGARATAQGGPFSLSWWTVDGGGGTSSGGGYSLSGTAGQMDAWRSDGAGYGLDGGFWQHGAALPQQARIFLPLLARG